jgi:hypothetical protein
LKRILFLSVLTVFIVCLFIIGCNLSNDSSRNGDPEPEPEPEPKDYLYFCVVENGEGTIKRCALDGSEPEGILTGLPQIKDIEVDVSGGKMYWVDSDNDDIYRANLDGLASERIFDGSEFFSVNISYLELDLTNSKIYLSDTNGEACGRICMGNLNGTNNGTFYQDCSRTIGLALDIPGNKIYCVSWVGEIRYYDLDDPDNNEKIDAPGAETGLELDSSAGKLYYVEWTGGIGIHRININGTGEELLNLTHTVDIEDLALDVVGGKMYWSTRNNGIICANLDGTGEEVVLESVAGVENYGIALALQLVIQ